FGTLPGGSGLTVAVGFVARSPVPVSAAATRVTGASRCVHDGHENAWAAAPRPVNASAAAPAIVVRCSVLIACSLVVVPVRRPAMRRTLGTHGERHVRRR